MRLAQKDPRAGLRRVALTVDDLGTSDASSEPALSTALLGHLKRYHAPVAVFVNCRKMRPDVLEQWEAAGATIGNHTNAHLSVDETGGPRVSQAWWSGVTVCDEWLHSQLAQPIRYFRFPYLRTGGSESQKRDAVKRLASIGYRVAPVSSPTAEWLLADYYEDARAYGDEALANEVVQRYVVHMTETLERAEQLAHVKGIERMAHITLMHANSLTADHLGDALEALEAQGWDFVSLEEALSDPVYSRRDAYAGKHGHSWLSRIEPAARDTDEDVFARAAGSFVTEFGERVEALKSAKAAEAAAQVVEALKSAKAAEAAAQAVEAPAQAVEAPAQVLEAPAQVLAQ
jgi:peptidoglycan/xylan/chitin deacetylase (PgdA/CDA1 family)